MLRPLVMASLLLAAGDSLGEAIMISLHHRASATGNVITLGDVATLHCQQTPLCRDMAHVQLSRSPVVGQVTKLDRKEIQQVIHPFAAKHDVEVKWSGAHAVDVARHTTYVDIHAYVDQAQKAFERHIRTFASSVVIRPVRIPVSVEMAVPFDSFRVRFDKRRWYATRTVIWLDLINGSQCVKSIPLRLDVEIWGNALVAHSAINKNDLTNQQQFKVERVNLTGLRGSVVSPTADLSGMRARHSLQPGDVLLESMVEPAPAVQAQKLILVDVKAGHVQLTTKAIAIHDAEIGEQVVLENPRSQQKFQARVVAVGLARVEN